MAHREALTPSRERSEDDLPPEVSIRTTWSWPHYLLVNSFLGALFVTFIRAVAVAVARPGAADSPVQDDPAGYTLILLGIVVGNTVGFSCLAIGHWLRPRYAHLQPQHRTLLYFTAFCFAGVVGAAFPLGLLEILDKPGLPILVLAIGLIAAAVSLNIVIFEEMRDSLATHYQNAQRQERTERDLRIARLVQRRMLPRSNPRMPGFDVAARSLPAKEVGGDYYDFIPLADGTTLVAIGDVSGKGLPAALLMAALRAGLRTEAAGGAPVHLPGMVARLNRLIHDSADRFSFVTFILGILDGKAGVLRYVNAGHNSPLLLRRDGTAEEAPPGGLVLGVLEQYEYALQEVALEEGEILLLYTDGMTEQHGLGELDFGADRMTAVVHAHREDPMNRALEHVYGALSDFTHATGDTQYDDQTLVLLKRTSPD